MSEDQKAYVIYADTQIEDNDIPETKILASIDQEGVAANLVEDMNNAIVNNDNVIVDYMEVPKNITAEKALELIKDFNVDELLEEETVPTDVDAENEDTAEDE